MQIMNKYFRARASMVFIMTNNEVMNQIIAFYRDLNGMLLTFGGTISKGQRGLKMKLKM
jgi:6-phosphogluconolactonase